jgi:hypothetical protein
VLLPCLHCVSVGCGRQPPLLLLLLLLLPRRVFPPRQQALQ